MRSGLFLSNVLCSFYCWDCVFFHEFSVGILVNNFLLNGSKVSDPEVCDINAVILLDQNSFFLQHKLFKRVEVEIRGASHQDVAGLEIENEDFESIFGVRTRVALNRDSSSRNLKCCNGCIK